MFHFCNLLYHYVRYHDFLYLILGQVSDEQVEILCELIYQYDYWLILGNIDRRTGQVAMQPECDQNLRMI